MEFRDDIEYAQAMDNADPLGIFRKRFIIPEREGKFQVYFLGNSLGLQPVNTADEIDKVLKQWAHYGVEGFFHGNDPWMRYHDKLVEPLGAVVGAEPAELVVMNQLSVNLHLMMVSFYRPEGKRKKIICEAKAFPSDQYMLETHLKHLGLDPKEIVIEVSPRPNEYHIRAEDIISSVMQHRDEVALVFWGGVNYYTGQAFDIPAITNAAHAAGAKAGFDLAHAAGNIRLALHDWNVDFACWCNYKYLNSGPGAVGGVFVHSRYHNDTLLRRFGGWWGYDKVTRFNMQPGFVPVASAEGWQLSTPSMLLYASHFAALKIFREAGFENILVKSSLMSSYLRKMLLAISGRHKQDKMMIITPQEPGTHGAQVSIFFQENGRRIFDKLSEAGIFTDWREPGVIRIAPVPLYNTFTEIHQFVSCLDKALED